MAEDIEQIRNAIDAASNSEITLAEFIALVSPYTTDNGEVLRIVMADDLRKFREMASRVYDTMTADVGDVLANEQLTMENRYKNECIVLKDATKEIWAIIKKEFPKFNMELYKANPNLINEMFPQKMKRECAERVEEQEARRRQEVHHRLRWLQNEGQRLQEENIKLEDIFEKLQQVTFELAEEHVSAEENASRLERQLQAEKTDLQNRLEKMNADMNELIVVAAKSKKLSPVATPANVSFLDSPLYSPVELTPPRISPAGKSPSPIYIPSVDSEGFDAFVDQYLEANKPPSTCAGTIPNSQLDESDDFDALLDAYLTENDLWSEDFRKKPARRK